MRLNAPFFANISKKLLNDQGCPLSRSRKNRRLVMSNNNVVEVSDRQRDSLESAGFNVDSVVAVVEMLSNGLDMDSSYEYEIEGLNYDRETHESHRLVMFTEVEVSDGSLSVVESAAEVVARLVGSFNVSLEERLLNFFCMGVADEVENVSPECVVELLNIFQNCDSVIVCNEIGYFG